MLDPELNIAFIGGGNMAEAILAGLIKEGHCPKKILVCAPSAGTQQKYVDQYQVVTSGDNNHAALFADVIVLAVKPHVIPTVCRELASQMASPGQQKLVISVAAGVSQARLRQLLGGSTRVVCAMPNLPSAVGEGMTGLYAGADCDVQDVALVESMMASIGETLWLQQEQLMTSIVATAGSSPAYFFLLMEVMQKIAVEQGMAPEDAKLSVQQAAYGAVSLAVESDLSFKQLREKVTSPKGTTEQALNQFIKSDIEGIVRKAMAAAARKTAENYLAVQDA